MTSTTLPTPSDEPVVVQVYLGPRSYDIVIVHGELGRSAQHFDSWMDRLTDGKPHTGRALIVTDRNVTRPHAETVQASLCSAGWNCGLIELEAGEKSKSLDVIATIYDRLVDLRADRSTVVVAVGGGVVGDAAGFAAATYNRGLPFIQAPTTLLSHVDSSVGGKVGINHPRAKNLIGSFHQPLGVLIDTSTLDTLPAREYISGLAEVIKYGVILDEPFFSYLEANVDGLRNRAPHVMRTIIARSCRLKADIVEQDEFERTGLRAVLNYGHTFAHAYEALCGFNELLHGEAVAIGMIHASQLAERHGLIGPEVTARQKKLVEAVSLPTSLPAAGRFSVEQVLDRMKLDKKAQAGRLRFILPSRIGKVQLLDDVPESLVRDVLADVLA